jgi:hypothetical protein
MKRRNLTPKTKKKRRTKSDMAAVKQMVKEKTESLEKYWPLTLRQIYYQLVADNTVSNKPSEYGMISKKLTDMRNDGEVSWDIMEDRTRREVTKRKFLEKADFIRVELGLFMKYYNRCLIQRQEKYVELWTEKDALSSVFVGIADNYCVTTVVCKGQLSTTFLKRYADRAKKAVGKGQKPVIIYGGDLDPSGWKIPISIEDRLWEEHDINVTIDRFALNPSQIEEYRLPQSPDAFKSKDPNAKEYKKEFGETAVELDALKPADLENLIKTALSKHLDLESMEKEREIQTAEREEIKELRRIIISTIEKERISL